jgi:malic enzyme
MRMLNIGESILFGSLLFLVSCDRPETTTRCQDTLSRTQNAITEMRNAYGESQKNKIAIKAPNGFISLTIVDGSLNGQIVIAETNRDEIIISLSNPEIVTVKTLPIGLDGRKSGVESICEFKP